MDDQLQELLNDRVFHHFYQICRIPHGSGNEKALSDYVYAWAKGLGLHAEQDGVYNVFIRKPASPGYENAPVTMLQAHLDMVCEKRPDSRHDFEKDPILLFVEGDLLTTGGETTLGADDGVGMALAMAVLEDDGLSHPELEVLFTVAEEDDFLGASHFDGAKIRSVYVINLDNAGDRELLCGSCGGMPVDWRLSVPREPLPAGYESYRLAVGGLRGGHSGEAIHCGHGNANILLGRALLLMERTCPYLISSIKGGSFRLAIPRDAEAVVSMRPQDAAEVQKRLAELNQDVCAELSESGRNVSITLEPADRGETGVKPGKIISAILLMPDGVHQMNESLIGLVDTSDNLGEMYLEERELHLVLEIRSAKNSLRTYLYERMARLAALLGAACASGETYPSWEFRPASKLRDAAAAAFREEFKKDPVIRSLHTGLEVGYLIEKKPAIDAIAIGPDMWDYHSPTEKLSISSTKRIYRYLCGMLSALQ